MRTKPIVNTRSVASHYETRNERIIEFSGAAGSDPGGLISIQQREDRTISITVYRCDQGVEVTVIPPNGNAADRPVTVRWKAKHAA